METRTANLIIGTSGGTAGGNATNYKLALPSTWIKEMGLTPEQRQQFFQLKDILLAAIEAENAEQNQKLKGDNQNG